jgi:hypothetical protein
MVDQENSTLTAASGADALQPMESYQQQLQQVHGQVDRLQSQLQDQAQQHLLLQVRCKNSLSLSGCFRKHQQSVR